MQEFLNRTSGITDGVIESLSSALYLASYFGFSYIALSMLTSFLSGLAPARLRNQSHAGKAI